MKKKILLFLILLISSVVFSKNIDIDGISTLTLINKNGDTSVVFDKSAKMWVTGYNTKELPLDITSVNGEMTIITNPGNRNLPTMLTIMLPKGSSLANIKIISVNGRVNIENFPSYMGLNVDAKIGTITYYGALNNLHVFSRGGIFYNGTSLNDAITYTWQSGSGTLKSIHGQMNDVWITKPVN
ncbi:MAG: hypothetical protein NTX05_00335 [Fusobacteria bacterium]|nr:hypothetical protein [Fusobacteriota bacterium]